MDGLGYVVVVRREEGSFCTRTRMRVSEVGGVGGGGCVVVQQRETGH